MNELRTFDGTVLKRLRNERGLSQTDVAFEGHTAGVKIKPVTVFRHENGRAEPKVSVLEFYAKFFKVSKEKFMKTEIANDRKSKPKRATG